MIRLRIWVLAPTLLLVAILGLGGASASGIWMSRETGHWVDRLSGFWKGKVFGTSLIPVPEFQNILVVGWDGVQRSRLEELLAQGRLPYLAKVIASGSYVRIDVQEGRTVTKPGWSQIFTGYDVTPLGIIENIYYQPIPMGLTIFERLKQKFGSSNVMTAFLTGKTENTGARGAHRVCVNCRHRYPETGKKTEWWDVTRHAPTKDGRVQRIEDRKGEPFYFAAQTMDVYRSALGSGDHVLTLGIETLRKSVKKRFFFFFHFEEPDEQGHVFGEDSAEYSKAIVENDARLGRLLDELKNLGLDQKTLVFVASDHGFSPGKRKHSRAPETFFVSSIAGFRKSGDRRDLAPTWYDLYGFPKGNDPKITGHSFLRAQ